MITFGTMLIERDAAHPPFFQLKDDKSPHEWMTIQHKLNFHELEKELAAAGWTFFFLANAVKTTAFGFDRAKIIRAATRRLIAAVRLQKCNCLEIHDVTMHSFLGMPYVSIVAHPRHLQKGAVFSG